jgi:hypothetical protein
VFQLSILHVDVMQLISANMILFFSLVITIHFDLIIGRDMNNTKLTENNKDIEISSKISQYVIIRHKKLVINKRFIEISNTFF